MPVLNVKALGVRYDREVVSGFDLSIEPGECVALMGPSGSGKSSIIGCIVGLQIPYEGTVEVGGRPVPSGIDARAQMRRELIGIAFQDAGLLPELTVAENVAVSLLFDGHSRDEAMAASQEALSSVGLVEHANKRVDEISGGQAQRVALARALVRPTAVLMVADEPTASLDRATAHEIAALLTSRCRQRAMGALVATHDPVVAASCDRVVEIGTAR